MPFLPNGNCYPPGTVGSGTCSWNYDTYRQYASNYSQNLSEAYGVVTNTTTTQSSGNTLTFQKLQEYFNQASGKQDTPKPNVKEKKAMTKYYKVVKEHPYWEIGAILEGETGDTYEAISDLWNKELKNSDLEDIAESADVIEHQPEWFERVYKVEVVGETARYLTKKEAQAAHAKLTKAKE